MTQSFPTRRSSDLDAHFANGTGNAFGDHVASHDAAEDVHQNGRDIAIGENDLERFGHAFLGGTTAHVEEVRRRTAMQVDDIHGAHGRSEEHTSELQSLMRTSYAVFCLKKTHKY